MNLLKNIFNFYINSSIHVTLAVCSFIGITAIEYDLSVSNSLMGFVFFGTITGYNFIKYAEIARFYHRSLNLSLRIIQVFSFLSFLALIYFAYQLPHKTLIITSGFGALTFFYAIPLLNNKNLRALIGLKIVIVSFVWAGVTVIIPFVNEGLVLTETNWISFIQRILLVFILTLPFEIRDLKYDELALGTVPQLIGVFYTKLTGILLLIITLLIAFFINKSEWIYTLSFGVISIVLLFFLMKSTKKQSQYFASFWVESIPIFWYVIMLFLES